MSYVITFDISESLYYELMSCALNKAPLKKKKVSEWDLIYTGCQTF